MYLQRCHWLRWSQKWSMSEAVVHREAVQLSVFPSGAWDHIFQNLYGSSFESKRSDSSSAHCLRGRSRLFLTLQFIFYILVKYLPQFTNTDWAVSKHKQKECCFPKGLKENGIVPNRTCAHRNTDFVFHKSCFACTFTGFPQESQMFPKHQVRQHADWRI